MRQTNLSWEDVRELILSDKPTYFLLKDKVGSLIASSNMSAGQSESSQKGMTPSAIVSAIENVLSKYGDGTYTIFLRSLPTSKADTTIRHLFCYGDVSEQMNHQDYRPQTQQFSGFGIGDLDSRVQTAVQQAIQHEREITDRDRKNDELKRRIEQLEKGDQQSQIVEALGDLGKVIAIGVISKIAPEALGTINKIYGDLPEPENDPNGLQ
jgi:hypothetical protein